MTNSWNIEMPETSYVAREVDPNLPKEMQITVGSDAFQTLMNKLKDQKRVSIDTETTGLVIWKDIPLYWSLAWQGERYTLKADTLPYFKEMFDDDTREWIFANAKYDAHILHNVGIDIAGKLVDTQVMHALLYEEKPHRLKYMTQHLLGYTWADFQDTFGKIGKRQSAEEMIRRAERENMRLLVEYASNDAHGTWEVHQKLLEQLELAPTHSLFSEVPPFINTLLDLFVKVEVPYTKTLWRMEEAGIRVDREKLEKASPEARAEIQQIEKDIAQQVGYVLNPRSTQQLRKYFFEEQGLTPLKMSSGGKTGVRQPSTDVGFLKHYASEGHPVAQLILKHREVSKLYGTYIEGLREQMDPNDRIHTRFNQDVARTGRLSSSDPNLQNIPRPANDKWNLRNAFIARDGYTIIAVDYEQLEMRLLAAASLEPKMINIFASGKDIHTGNVEMVFGIPYDDVVKAKKVEKQVKSGELPESAMTPYVVECLKRRAHIKNIGFGLNYGMGPAKLARDLGITLQEAEELIDKYMKTYPAVGKFFKEAVRETEESGYAFTIAGRRRNVPEIASHRKDERALGERLAVNTQIQGSAADACKMAQINLDKVDIEGRYGCRQLLQVHDEIVFECPTEMVDEVMPEIIDLMEHPFPQDLSVHLAVDAGHGASWGVAK